MADSQRPQIGSQMEAGLGGGSARPSSPHKPLTASGSSANGEERVTKRVDFKCEETSASTLSYVIDVGAGEGQTILDHSAPDLPSPTPTLTLLNQLLECHVNWLLIEAPLRKGYQLVGKLQLRLMIQVAGCKPHRCGILMRQLLLDVATSSSLDVRLATPKDSAVGFTVRELWSRQLFDRLTIGEVVDQLSAFPPPACSTVVLSSPKDAGMGCFPRGKDWYLTLTEATFCKAMCQILSKELKGDFEAKDPQRRFRISRSLVERQAPLVILCGGTSGCGKSTIAGLLCSRLGVHRTMSTDTIRETLRLKTTPQERPELFTSTYCGDEVASTSRPTGVNVPQTATEKLLAAYTTQSQLILTVVDQLIENAVTMNEPILLEGVHLHPDYMAKKALQLAEQGIPCIPFLVYVRNETKHKERLSVRGKSLSLDPKENKYVLHFTGIRTIQSWVVSRAQYHEVFLVNNTNIDRSLTRVHLYLLGCLERWTLGNGWGNGGEGQGLSLLPSVSGETTSRATDTQPKVWTTTVQSVGTKEALRRILARKEEKKRLRSRSVGSNPPPTTEFLLGGNPRAPGGEGILRRCRSPDDISRPNSALAPGTVLAMPNNTAARGRRKLHFNSPILRNADQGGRSVGSAHPPGEDSTEDEATKGHSQSTHPLDRRPTQASRFTMSTDESGKEEGSIVGTDGSDGDHPVGD